MTNPADRLKDQDTAADTRWELQQIADELGIKYETLLHDAMRLYIAAWRAKERGVWNPTLRYAIKKGEDNGKR